MLLNQDYLKQFSGELNKSRVTYSNEHVFPWLPVLLDVYHIVDMGVQAELFEHLKSTGRRISCRKGCGSCCKLLTIPINEFEYGGLFWYITRVVEEKTRKILKARLLELEEDDDGCPFLINEICAVYPVRPISCRQFFMCDTPCVPGENPWIARYQDIFIACNKDIRWLIASKFLEIYGIKEEDQRRVIEEGFSLNENNKPICSFLWKKIATKM